jgi:hypothetical protein
MSEILSPSKVDADGTGWMMADLNVFGVIF